MTANLHGLVQVHAGGAAETEGDAGVVGLAARRAASEGVVGPGIVVVGRLVLGVADDTAVSYSSWCQSLLSQLHDFQDKTSLSELKKLTKSSGSIVPWQEDHGVGARQEGRQEEGEREHLGVVLGDEDCGKA